MALVYKLVLSLIWKEKISGLKWEMNPQPSMCMGMYTRHLLDTSGAAESVLIKELCIFEQHCCTHLYLAGTVDSVLIKEVHVLIDG